MITTRITNPKTATPTTGARFLATSLTAVAMAVLLAACSSGSDSGSSGTTTAGTTAVVTSTADTTVTDTSVVTSTSDVTSSSTGTSTSGSSSSSSGPAGTCPDSATLGPVTPDYDPAFPITSINCSGEWAVGSYAADGKNDTTGIWRDVNGAWIFQDRAAVCAKADNLPPELYKQACASN